MVVTVAAAYLYRASLGAAAVELFLPRVISRATDTRVTIASVELKWGPTSTGRREQPVASEWTLRLDEMESRRPESPTATPLLKIVRTYVRFPSLWSLRDPLAAITSVELVEVSLRVPPTERSASQPTESSSWLPQIVMPTRLPSVPFPIRVSHLDFSYGSLEGHDVSVVLTPSTVSMTVPAMAGVPGIEALRLQATVTESAVRNLLLRAMASDWNDISLTGELLAEEDAWRGNFNAFEVTLPTQSNRPIALRSRSVEVATLMEWIQRWTGLDSAGLPGGVVRFDAELTPTGVSADIDLALTAGRVQARGTADREQIRIEAQSTELAVGELLGPYLANDVGLELSTALRLVASIPLASPTWDQLVIEGSAQASDGRLTVHGQPLPVHRLVAHTKWRPPTRPSEDRSPLWCAAELQLADGSFVAEGSGTFAEFGAAVHMEGLDVGALLGTFLTERVELRAPCSGDFTISGALRRPAVRGSLISRSGYVAWLGQSHAYDTLEAEAFWQGSTLEIANVRARILDATVELGGELRTREGRIEHFQTSLTSEEGSVDLRLHELTETTTRLNARARSFDLGYLAPLFVPPQHEITVPVNGTVEFSWDAESWRVSSDLSATRATYRLADDPDPSAPTTKVPPVELEQVALRGHYDSRTGLEIEQLDAHSLNPAIDVMASITPIDTGSRVAARFVSKEGSAELSGVTTAEALGLTITLDELDVGPTVSLFYPQLELNTALSGSIHISGTQQAPEATIRLNSSTGHVGSGGRRARYDDLEVAAIYDERGLRLDEASVVAFAGTIAARGRVAVGADQSYGTLLEYRDLDVGSIRELTPFLRGLAGEVSGHLRLTGPYPPAVALAGAIRKGEVAFEGWERLRSIEGRFNYSDRQFRLLEVKGRSGDGSLIGHGSLRLAADALTIEHYSATVDLDRVLLGRSADAFVRVTGTATLDGSPAPPSLRGDLEIVRGLYYRNYYPRLGTGTSLPFELFSIEDGYASEMQLDLGLRLRGGFRIENNRVQITPHGTLRLLGSGRNPYLLGQLSATEGKLSLPHLNLEIGYAELQFPTDDPFRPTISLQGDGTTRDHEVRLTVSGPFDGPEVRFRSTPELPDEELLALVATGRFPEELSAEGAEQVAAIELARVYAPEVAEWIFGRSTEDGILDAVDVGINSARSADEQDRITVRVRVNDHVAILGERDNRGDVNLDVEFFWWIP